MTLAIRTLKLIAFRSYARLDLEVTAPMIALTGANGAGKTNILEAISLLAPGRGLRRASPTDFARKAQGIGWAVTATLDTPTDPVTLWTGAGTDARRTAKQDDKATSVLSLGRTARLLWLTPALDRVFVEGPGERRRFLDRMTLSLLPDHAETATRYDRAMRERNRVLKDGGDPRWLTALEAQMAEHGVALARGRGTRGDTCRPDAGTNSSACASAGHLGALHPPPTAAAGRAATGGGAGGSGGACAPGAPPRPAGDARPRTC